MRTVWWDPAGPTLHMIDQRLLPERLSVLDLHNSDEVAEAIRTMAVRGAPARKISCAKPAGMRGCHLPMWISSRRTEPAPGRAIRSKSEHSARFWATGARLAGRS